MSRRTELWICLTIAAAAAAARGVLFMAPGVRFDADQAIVGLMAKHISEGAAFPVFFYGQSYLLAVEAYLAAPVMWLLGPTEVALKVPVLAMNAAVVLLVVWRAHVDLGLRPWLALAGTLPLLVPPIVPGTRLMEAMGGNIEPLFYALLLWVTRTRPWTFGLVLALGLAHREMTAYAAGALALLEFLYHPGWPARATWQRWGVAVVLVVSMSAAVAAARPFGAMFGPGTIARPANLDITSGDAVASQICLVPSRWPGRGAQLVGEHLPMMMGGLPGPISEIGVSSGVGQGNPGAAWWALGLTLAGLAFGLAALWRGHVIASGVRDDRASTPPDGVPGRALPWFLILTGLASAVVYAFVACTQITINSLRYDLLVVFVPVGALLAGLVYRAAAVRAALVTAALLWAVVMADDYRALAGEVQSGRWPDHRGALVAELEARGLHVLWGDFRLAYVVTFRSAERVVVAPTEVHRVDRYAREAAAANAPMLRQGRCAEGESLGPGYMLCRPPTLDERPLY